eukprot:7654926-Karenia_brevis.AAC.1
MPDSGDEKMGDKASQSPHSQKGDKRPSPDPLRMDGTKQLRKEDEEDENLEDLAKNYGDMN